MERKSFQASTSFSWLHEDAVIWRKSRRIVRWKHEDKQQFWLNGMELFVSESSWIIRKGVPERFSNGVATSDPLLVKLSAPRDRTIFVPYASFRHDDGSASSPATLPHHNDWMLEALKRFKLFYFQSTDTRRSDVTFCRNEWFIPFSMWMTSLHLVMQSTIFWLLRSAGHCKTTSPSWDQAIKLPGLNYFQFAR